MQTNLYEYDKPVDQQHLHKGQLPEEPAVLRQHRLQGPALPEYRTPAGMRREEFRAMGTTITMLLPESQGELGVKIVRALFAEWEQTLSRFLPESELSRLNQHAGTSVAVSDLLYHVLATALIAAQATQGVYDPALLEQLKQVGYDRTFDALDELPTARFSLILPGEPGEGDRGLALLPQGSRHPRKIRREAPPRHRSGLQQSGDLSPYIGPDERGVGPPRQGSRSL